MGMVYFGDIAEERRETIKTKSENCPVVGLEHITPGEIKLSNWDVGTDNTFTKFFHKGDILFGRRRAYLKKAAVAPFDGICSGDITTIKAKESEILPELLPFVVQNDAFFDFAVGKSAGSLSPRVKWEHLKTYQLNLPSMDEQKRLTKILMAAEETRQAYKKLIKQTDELVKAKFEEMFGDINKLTGTEKITNIVEIRDDLRAPLNDVERADLKNGVLYPYYGATGCVDRINKYKIDFKAICIAEDCGNYDANAETSYIINEKCWVNNHAHVLSVKEDKCITEFLNYYFKIMDFTNYISGTTRAKLTRGKLEQIMIALPELSAQKIFVAFLQQAEQTKLAAQQSLDALNETVRALVNRNFN